DQRLVHIARMAGRVAQARDGFDGGHPMEETAKRPGTPIRTFAVIGVDVLADQGHLAHPGIREPLDLSDDLFNRPRDLSAARVRTDAKGEDLAAAFLHGDEGGHAARSLLFPAWGSEEVELVLDRKFSIDDALAGRTGNEARQSMVALWPAHQVNRRCAADDLLPFSLRHAAGDRDQNLAALACRRLLDLADTAKLGIDLFHRFLANMAGIEDDEVGLLGDAGLDETFRRQYVRHTMRIVDVHLAAERLDV